MSYPKIIAVIAILCFVSCSGKLLKGASSSASGQDNEKTQSVVFFDYDSSKLTIEGKKVLDKESENLAKVDTTKKIIVEGHCDERGTEAYNMALGKKRANAVKHYLLKKGVKASKITAVSYGESRPADLGHDESAWSKNRRGVVVIAK